MEDNFTVAEVDRIAKLSDPVIRNLQITQCYYDLSQAMTRRLGSVANWCTFATWASKQAGQTIRHEDLSRTAKPVLEHAPAMRDLIADLAAVARQFGARHDKDKFFSLVWEAINPAAAMERAGNSVARGNQKVFEEIGREFARFITTCGADQSFDADNLARFSAELRPGPPPDGQQYLKQAFSRYYQAFFENDVRIKAELILLANIEIGFHEQTRLQPEIAAALEASVADPRVFETRLFAALFPTTGWIIIILLYIRRSLQTPSKFDGLIDRILAAARHRIRLFLTDNMMTLNLPTGQIRLGRDLKADFPETLRHPSNADLRALLKQIDPTPDSVRDTGAVDWADLPDRIHFIADLFRCYQENTDLLAPPFSPEQVTAFKAGLAPDGEL